MDFDCPPACYTTSMPRNNSGSWSAHIFLRASSLLVLLFCTFAVPLPLQADAALTRTLRLAAIGDDEAFPYTTSAFTPSNNLLVVMVHQMTPQNMARRQTTPFL
jgi:hypothetical protein